MKEELLVSESVLKPYSPNEIFFCPEESQFYAQCLERMVFDHCTLNDVIVEFGAGEGTPVISCLLKTFFKGTVHGFELNTSACRVANSRIAKYHLNHKYIIYNSCFFKKNRLVDASYLIANPPYLPAPDNNLYIPSLHGGFDGAAVTKQLLGLEYENVFLMISSYSNPIEVVDYSVGQGYQINDFMISPLRFGYYSCQPKVKETISALREKQQAFYSQNIYFLAGVLFGKRNGISLDLSEEFIKVMTAL
jgi:methylase of polypeptide subunit release factors